MAKVTGTTSDVPTLIHAQPIDGILVLVQAAIRPDAIIFTGDYERAEQIVVKDGVEICEAVSESCGGYTYILLLSLQRLVLDPV
jgi:hypothetical protein